MKKIDIDLIFISNECQAFNDEILRIRNENSNGFLNQNQIIPEEHELFMDENCRNYWVLMVKNEKTGWLPGDVVGFVGCVDGDIRVAIDPRHKRKGYAKRAINFITKKRPFVSFAWIKEDNEVSQKLFASCGYSPTGESKIHDGIVVMKYLFEEKEEKPITTTNFVDWSGYPENCRTGSIEDVMPKCKCHGGR